MALDVIIIGGGPAGMSTAFWCAELGLKSILLEAEGETGGQLLRIYNPISNYLGLDATSGVSIRDKFVNQLESKRVEIACGARVCEVGLSDKTVRTDIGARFQSQYIVIATGVRRRVLDVPGETEFRGRGILRSGAESANEMVGKTVVIIGGGDAALENAAILSETAKKIYVVHRGREFSARREFVEAANSQPSVEFLFGKVVTAFRGIDTLSEVEICEVGSQKASTLQVDHGLIRIGVEPNTELFRGQIDLDNAGYVEIDKNCQTSLCGVFAVGDIGSQSSQTIASAVGHGAIAARKIADDVSIILM